MIDFRFIVENVLEYFEVLYSREISKDYKGYVKGI